MAIIILAGWGVATFGGCTKLPYAATVNTRPEPPGAEPEWTPVLHSRDRAEVAAAMRDAVPPGISGDDPTAAPHGVRWADVELAVSYAADDAEMAVTQVDREPSLLRFRLKTVNDRPAWLEIRRVDPPLVYEASARVGWFDDPESAQRLLTAFDKWMRTFGKKRSFENEPAEPTADSLQSRR